MYFSFIIRLAALSLALFFATTAIACHTTRHKVNPAKLSEKYHFVGDGKVTKQTIVNRFGKPDFTYENERIIGYICDEESKQYNLVLVFNEDDVLERNGIVRVR